MEKLTLEHIAPFMPYGLKIYLIQKGPFVGSDNVEKIQDLEVFKDLQLPLSKSRYRLVSAKPILRPMNLTQPITVDGKEIIPIVELAKIGDIEFINKDVEFRFSENVSGCKYNDGLGYESVFSYSSALNSFAMYHQQTKKEFRPNNQLTLFKKLYEWKFDVAGLIAAGLAIDVNTLETNPYE